jgi:predicted small lipoprotein YifL
MRKVICVVVILLVAAIVGCGSGAPLSPDKQKEAVEKHLPKGGKVVEILENDWYIVKIKDRKYLYRNHNNSCNSATETITEYRE